MVKNRIFKFLLVVVGLTALGFGQLSYSVYKGRGRGRKMRHPGMRRGPGRPGMKRPGRMMEILKKQQEEINVLRKKLGMEPIQFQPPGRGVMHQKMSDRFEGLKKLGEQLGLKMPEQPVAGKCTLIPVLEKLVKKVLQQQNMIFELLKRTKNLED